MISTLNLEDVEKQLKRKIYRNSYFEFFKFAFNVLFPEELYVDAPHVKFLCDVLQEEARRIKNRIEKERDLIINIPPRTSKSLICSVIYNAWVWIDMPSATFICVSFDEDLSLLNAQYTRDLIKSDQYQALFSDVFQIRSDVDSKSFFANNKTGFRLSKTIGGNITGHKGLFIILDDPMNPKTSESETNRLTVIAYFQQSLYNRLTPVNLGLRILVMQRLHQSDLTGHLLKENPDAYRHICLPAEISDKISPPECIVFYVDNLLDPNRLSKKTLLGFFKTLGGRSYAGQYDQIPGAKEGIIFKRAFWTIIQPELVYRDPFISPIHFVIDSAYTKNTSNDPTAIWVGFRKDNFLYTIEVKEVWLEFPELCNFIMDYTARMGATSYSKIFIEPKASGKSVVQQLRAQTMLNVIESTNPDSDKVTRAHGVTAILQSQRNILIAGSYIENYLDQLCTFPNATHDDMVDVTVNAINEVLIEGSSVDVYFI